MHLHLHQPILICLSCTGGHPRHAAVEELPDGVGYRVGVHIADVSHFVLPGTALDREAQQRSTSGGLRAEWGR